jgi:hypothetical protein
MSCSTRWRAERTLQAAGLALLLAGSVQGWAQPAEVPAGAVRASLATSHPLLPGSRLQGEAAMRYFGLRIYHARLWTLPQFRADSPTGQPLVLELEYQRDLNGRAIAERSLKEMQRAGGFSETQAQGWLAQMQALFPDVRAGDRLAGVQEPGQGAAFWLNGQRLGGIDDPQFAQQFFGIWLAPTTSEPELRRGLLALGARGTP